MKRMFSFLMILAIGSSIKCFSQITTNELPISVQKKVVANLSANRSSIVSLPIPDMDRVLKEDQEREKNGNKLKRISVGIPVSISMDEYGQWTTLEDGGKLWQLQISAEKAKALDFVFSKFWLPDGGKFFVFNPLTLETIGAITSEYLLGSKDTPHRFSTAMVKGDNVILEYYQPKDVKELPIIEVAKVYYGDDPYIDLDESCDDEVNVNCSEGANWQNEKKAIAGIYIKLHYGYRGTGALLNNTKGNYSPYFLTANHCLLGDDDPEPKDVHGDSDISDWVFYWNYELTSCNASYNPQSHKTTIGALLLANNPNTDFALLLLLQSPLSLSDYIPYYLGWDRSGSSGTGGVCIHHPVGDVKKISTYSMTPIATTFDSSPSVYWGVNWDTTDHGHGITEEGSSGSPLINSNHRVIGQLRGGASQCSGPYGLDYYGKFNLSWTGNGTSDIRRRLDYWLDSNGTNAQSINGVYPLSISGSSLVCSTATYTLQKLVSGATVVWSTSNSNLSIISGQGTSSATFQKNSNGACVITAQISIGSFTQTVTKNVWAGIPAAPTIIGWPHTNMFLANSQYQLFASTSSLAQASEYQWDVVSGATITSGANTNGPTFTINSSGTVRIGVRARNACGWGPYTYMNGGITNDNGQTPINSPGNNIVNIPLPEEGEYEIMLWNTNRLIRTVKTSQSSYDVDLNDLPSDLYIIKVMKDGQSIYQLKVKK